MSEPSPAQVAEAMAFLDKSSKLGDLIGFEVVGSSGDQTWSAMWGYKQAPSPSVVVYGPTLKAAMVALVEGIKAL